MRKSRRSKSIAGYRRRAARRSGRAKLYSASEWKSIARVHRHHFGRRPKKRSYRKNCGMCARGRNPDRRMWTFMGYDVFPADRNSSGIRWYSRSGRGYYLKADTKNGMKQLIRAERGNTRYEGNPSKKGPLKMNSNIWRYIFLLQSKELDGRLTNSEKKHLEFWREQLGLKA